MPSSRWKLAPLTGWFVATAGCYTIPPDWVDDLVYQTLDYRLDRPRVLGIRLDPPVAAPGLVVTIDALALAPPGLDAGPASVSLCGLRTDALVDVSDPECFRDASLVLPLGEGLPLRWVVPTDLRAPCADTWLANDSSVRYDTGAGGVRWPFGCTSSVPLQVRVPFGDGVAIGQVQVPVAMTEVPSSDIPPSALSGLTLHVLGDAAAEAVVTVRLEGRGPATDTRVAWYCDDGEWLGTGITRTDAGEDGWFQASNQLRLPRFFDGPVRVAAVATHHGFNIETAGRAAWATAEITPEVTP